MKYSVKIIILTIALITSHQSLITLHAQVGINDSNASPDASAMLDVKSSTKGVLIPRMTTTERDAISLPTTGLMVYNTSTNQFNFYNGTVWINVSNQLADADNNTKIQVEESTNDNIIRFDINGTEVLTFKKNTNGNVIVQTSETNNTFYGNGVALNNTGSQNTFFGGQSGFANTSGYNNTFLGRRAGFANTTGFRNTFLGSFTGSSHTTGISNTFLGATAGRFMTTGSRNVLIGDGSGQDNTTGNNNVMIGYGAGLTGNGSGNIFIGQLSGADEPGSNKLYIENTNSTRPLIYGDFANDTVKIYGTLGVKDAYQFPITDGTNGQVLQTNGSGQLSWITATAADHLGNHTATQNIQLNSNWLSNDGGNEGIGIDNTGEVGIGTTNPQSKFHINGGSFWLGGTHSGGLPVAAGSGIRMFTETSNTVAYLYAYDYTNTQANNMALQEPGGLVGIGRVPTTNRLEVNGNASKASAGSWLANSDARLKTNIQPLSPEKILNDLLALQGVTYEWNDTITGNDRPKGIQYGFTAQNIQQVFPILVNEDEQGYLQTAYGTYDAMTVEAIRALNDKIEQLKTENEVLKIQVAKVNQHQNEIDELKAMLGQLQTQLKQ
jgi:hypothetical protein